MAERRKLMFVLPRMNGGGAERVVSIIANHMCETYDVTILVLVSNESFYPLDERIRFVSANYEVDRRNKVTRLVSLGRNFLRAIGFVRERVNEIQPDIVFSLLEETDIVTFFALIGKKHIVRLCSERNDPTKRNTLIQTVLNRIYSRCDCLICQSETVAKYYRKIPEERKVVIPNPVDFSAYPDRVAEGTQTRIVAAGRLRPQKNFRLLIDSFAAIASQYPQVKLTIYGEGVQRTELEARVQELGLESRIELPGASQDLLVDIRDAAIFVMSSDYEGFPNALVEAIAMGIPVISTDFPTGVAREIIAKDVGLIVPCGDQIAMSGAIKSLLSDEEVRQIIRKEGWKCLSQFETENIVQNWKTVIDQLLYQ